MDFGSSKLTIMIMMIQDILQAPYVRLKCEKRHGNFKHNPTEKPNNHNCFDVQVDNVARVGSGMENERACA